MTIADGKSGSVDRWSLSDDAPAFISEQLAVAAHDFGGALAHSMRRRVAPATGSVLSAFQRIGLSPRRALSAEDADELECSFEAGLGGFFPTAGSGRKVLLVLEETLIAPGELRADDPAATYRDKVYFVADACDPASIRAARRWHSGYPGIGVVTEVGRELRLCGRWTDADFEAVVEGARAAVVRGCDDQVSLVVDLKH